MKISIIIPVYNVENYILQCLNSILNQTIKDIEIIIVNDGSTDNSINNIEKVVKENNNIKIIHKKNGGLSSARNEGLKYAKGEYVMFIDSDDYIEKDFLEILYREAKNYDLDIVFGGYKKFFSNNRIEVKHRKEQLLDLGIVEGNEFLLAQLENQDYRVEVWDDLYKRVFLLENNLFFFEGILHEDEEYTPRVLLAAKRVKLVDTYGYMYRQRENSITSSNINHNHIISIELILNIFTNHFEKTKIKNEKLIFSKLCFYLFDGYINKVLKMNSENRYTSLKWAIRRKIISTINYNINLNWKQRLYGLLFIYTPYLYYKIRYLRAEKG